MAPGHPIDFSAVGPPDSLPTMICSRRRLPAEESNDVRCLYSRYYRLDKA